MNHLRVKIWAADPISRIGLASSIRGQAGVVVVQETARERADVVVAVSGRLTSEVFAGLRDTSDAAPVILLQDEVDSAVFPDLGECRVAAILPRAAVADGRLVRSVRAVARGENVGWQALPPQQEKVSSGAKAAEDTLKPREIAVLRLAAEGLDTDEIAGKLCYSRATVKNIVYAIMSRLNLRSRAHAVAYAMRAGII